MIYVGNFSYNDSADEADNYVLMPATVKADSTEEALDKFAALFERLHNDTDLIAGADEIYLDTLIEMDDVPEDAVLLQWQKIAPCEDGLYSILSAEPEEREDATAYGWDFEDEEDEDEEGHTHEERDDEPFISF